MTIFKCWNTTDSQTNSFDNRSGKRERLAVEHNYSSWLRTMQSKTRSLDHCASRKGLEYLAFNISLIRFKITNFTHLWYRLRAGSFRQRVLGHIWTHLCPSIWYKKHKDAGTTPPPIGWSRTLRRMIEYALREVTSETHPCWNPRKPMRTYTAGNQLLDCRLRPYKQRAYQDQSRTRLK